MRSLAIGLIALSLPGLALAQELRNDLMIEQEVEAFDTGIIADEIAENEREKQRLAIEQQEIEKDIQVYKEKARSMANELQASRKSLAEAKQSSHEQNLKLTEAKKAHDELVGTTRQIAGELSAANDVLSEQRRQIDQLKESVLRKKQERKALLQRRENAKKAYQKQTLYLQKLRDYDAQIARANQVLAGHVEQLEAAKARRKAQDAADVKLSSL